MLVQGQRLTEKQKTVFKCFRDEQPRFLICHGAKRSGKTFVLTLIWLAHIAKYKGRGLNFAMGGATQGSVRRNVLDDMSGILGKELKPDKAGAVSVFGNKVYIFDGANSDSWEDVRGFTSAGLYLSEGTVLHNDFVKEAISRCSFPGARVLIDTNPENPLHPIKTDYIDKSGERLENGRLNIQAFHFKLLDNNFLDPDYVQSMLATTPPGIYYNRDILGQWTMSSGVVYDVWKDEFICDDDDPECLKVKQFGENYIAIDYGTTNPCVFLNIYDDGETILINNEYYYDFKKKLVQKTDEEYAQDLDEFKTEKLYKVVIDPSAANFKLVLKNRGYIVIDAKNAVMTDTGKINGIRKLSSLIYAGKIRINKRCQNLLRELSVYSWDEEAVKRGIERPLKKDDHSPDALRYYSNTFVQNWRVGNVGETA